VLQLGALHQLPNASVGAAQALLQRRLPRVLSNKVSRQRPNTSQVYSRIRVGSPTAGGDAKFSSSQELQTRREDNVSRHTSPLPYTPPDQYVVGIPDTRSAPLHEAMQAAFAQMEQEGFLNARSAAMEPWSASLRRLIYLSQTEMARDAMEENARLENHVRVCESRLAAVGELEAMNRVCREQSETTAKPQNSRAKPQRNQRVKRVKPQRNHTDK